MFRKKLAYNLHLSQIKTEAKDVCGYIRGYASDLADGYLSYRDVGASGIDYSDTNSRNTAYALIGPRISTYIAAQYIWYESTYVSTLLSDEHEKLGAKALEVYLSAINTALGPRARTILAVAMNRFATDPRRIEYILAVILSEEFKLNLEDHPRFLERNHNFFHYCMEARGIKTLRKRFPVENETMLELVEDIGGYAWPRE